MRYKLIVAPIALLFAYACNVLQPGGIKQGVSGYIYLRTGNQMPSFDRPSSKGRGVSREVFFYTPASFSDVSGSSPLFSGVNTKLILRVKSDNKGFFKAKLPAGNYSMFVKEGHSFFGSISDGNGIINPVTVDQNTITKHDLTITANAAY
ncbi:hypothetical protein [Mucilaginibacter myungsuensis]|uniref:Carboxypeptidase regulatory-like domain-containing protein n=1 Tax=Mucilaginibacter myungsuensis TaxID=649104 RepID=A0A929KYS3_9SPHI|nr:hypothetical protein [Mucilaginibacter myungsuensis]MBE9664166.1 hypothetical protein [Mucilaginibacter myungsuensis]MDN3599869.1 hypothetical protein [Mucilaginibacter myungsuensis]